MLLSIDPLQLNDLSFLGWPCLIQLIESLYISNLKLVKEKSRNFKELRENSFYFVTY